ncbi:hypothetical protein BDZ45DRAFT_747768 [Acephala macrosclerotiorum]|nr:hypothetical protein BDZ45DRAFT_747768 [Acephala macrosclerotiorum]
MLLLLLCAVLITSGVHGAIFNMTASQLASVKVGTPFELTWTDASGAVTLLLKNGTSSDLVTVETIATRWSLGPMRFDIDDNSGPNYSVQFALAGASASSSSASSSATSSSSSLAKYYVPINALSEFLEQSILRNIFRVVFQYIFDVLDFVTEASQTASPTPSGHSGLSTGSKAAIGIGATFGAVLFAAFGAFTFWYGKRSASRRSKAEGPVTGDKPELGAGVPRQKELAANVPLNEAERSELERRRRAVELDSSSPLRPTDTVSERAELEALRERSTAPIEMGHDERPGP